MNEDFGKRHLGFGESDFAEILAGAGFESEQDFLRRIVPAGILLEDAPQFSTLDFEGASLSKLSEVQTQKKFQELAGRNGSCKPMLGLGYYGCRMPAPVKRLLLENPSWYTAYTPYQAEISQGRLEMLFNFQTMVASLCALDMANASLLDEATAAAEAMTMLRGSSKSQGSVFLVDADTHPQTLAVLQTRAEAVGITLKLCSREADYTADLQEAFGCLLSYPTSSGLLQDPRDLIAAMRSGGVRTAIATDLLALCLIEPPGSLGASIAVGSSQRFGLPMGAGGPHAGFMAFEADLVRRAPGRLVGLSKDSTGRPALRLALQTREQHIRRAKATSNICTAQVLPAMVSAAYAIYHGPEGLKEIAGHVHGQARKIAAACRQAGIPCQHEAFFDTLRIKHPDPDKALQAAEAEQIDLLANGQWLGLSVDETTTDQDLASLCKALRIEAAAPIDSAIPAALERSSPYLTQAVFSRYRSEHSFMRYLGRLAAKDIALDRSMIPLGSCTMKLNAATEMETISEPAWVDQHPFSPADRRAGINALAADLGSMLVSVTGFDAISLQPNAGSQGEYAGLLAIRGYHRSRGDTGRDICLIPDSAHGTNPASAVMAGMEVVPVGIDEKGDIRLDDLAEKAEKHSDRLAALMVTYPSTFGVYSLEIQKMCEIVHEQGGQVYMDGANLNALVGVAQPGKFGADVMHINLHKTFCIPHGGGGPGMGPIVCLEHLAPHLPGHPYADGEQPRQEGAVSAAPLGSAALLAISWAYMRMMDADGLRHATTAALLAANYMAQRLAGHYKLAFTGAHGEVAHEFVLDLKEFKRSSGVTVEDVAKRLIDMGFHAPTISFPVADSIMVEPTESESKEELDRYCDALIKIREEIAAIESGQVQRDDSPLGKAPHPAEDLLAEDWGREYSRAEAAYPLAWVKSGKYWPPVSRIDQVHGDRNLVCVLADEDQS